jgi:hypothetical protein
MAQTSVPHRSVFHKYSEYFFAFLGRNKMQVHIFAPVGTVDLRSIRQRGRVFRERVLLRKERRFLQLGDSDNAQRMGKNMSEDHTFRDFPLSIRGIDNPDHEWLHWQNLSNSILHIGAQVFTSLEGLQETKSGHGSLHPDRKFYMRGHCNEFSDADLGHRKFSGSSFLILGNSSESFRIETTLLSINVTRFSRGIMFIT